MSSNDCEFSVVAKITQYGQEPRGAGSRLIGFIRTAPLLVLSVAALVGQPADDAPELRALNGRVLNHYEAVGRAAPSERAALRSQAAFDLERRAAALSALIRNNPAAALLLGFSEDLLEDLRMNFPDSGGLLERRGRWRGVLESLVADDFANSRSSTSHRLKSENRAYELYFAGPPPKASSGAVLELEGLEVAGAIAVQGDGVPVDPGGEVAQACGLTGAQNVAAILVNLPNYSLNAGVDGELVRGILYGNSYTSRQSGTNWSVDDFWQENSDGKTSAPYSTGVVAGPYQLASNFNTVNGVPSCDYMGLSQAAINAADAHVDFRNYNRVVVVFPYNGACSWAGLSSIGCWSNTAAGDGTFVSSISWLRADQLTGRDKGVQLATHELGHGLGLHHANTREFPGPPREPLAGIGVQGAIVEYGDTFSTMGSWNFGFYAASQAQENLSWLTASNYQIVTAPGQYQVEAYETRNAPNMVKALKIQREAGSDSFVWVEYRTNTGIYNSQLGSQVWSGALIRYDDSYTGIYSHLLDFTPTTATFSDPALTVGQTWIDPYSSLSITVNDIVGSKLNITVNYGPAPCVRNNPLVKLSPPNPTVNTGASAAFTVTVQNQDTAACPGSTFNLTSSQPSGFTATLSPTAISIAPGASGTATLTEKAGSTTGTFAVSSTAANAAYGSYIGTGSANVTVTSACVRANPTVTLTPQSAIVGSAGSKVFTVAIRNNDTSLCGSSTLLFSSTQPAGFTGTFSKTSLTVSPGATVSVTLTEKAGTSSGTFTFSVLATNKVFTTYVGSATGTVTVEPCTMAAPTVSVSPGSQMIAPGLSKPFTVSVKNNHSATCANATFSMSSTQPSGFTGAYSATSLTLASGATGTVTLTEKAGSASGTFSFVAKATTGTTYTASATGSVDVVPCTNAAPTVVLAPASATMNAGGSQAFTVNVTNNHGPSCAPATFTMSSTQPSGLTGTYSATSVTVASGATGTVTLTEVGSATTGTLVFTAKATTGTSYVGSAGGSVTVVPVTLTLSTNASSYVRPAKVVSTARLFGATGASGASVKFTLTKSNGRATTATVVTDASGYAVWSYSLATADPIGSYKIVATATYGRVTYTSNQATFTVQ